MPSEIVRAAEHDRDRSLGWLGVKWIEYFCVHGPGDIQGRPLLHTEEDAIPLSNELVALTVDCYALNDRGQRLYDSTFYSRPKGADKSGHAARIALFEALGPCRFAGWARGGEVFEWMDFRYVYRPGEPMGRRITYPFLRILATEEGQTGNVYDSVYLNLSEGPLREAFSRKDDVGLTRVFLPGGGEIRPSTASSAAKDGGKETWTNFDETHLYILPELLRMHSTVRRNMAKRRDAEPWSFESSTMYEPGRNSVAEQTHTLAKSMASGKARVSRLLFDHREGFPDTDMDDEDALRRSLIEAYGDASAYMPIERIIHERFDTRNDQIDWQRYFLNQARSGASKAFNLDAWYANARPMQYIENGEKITLGFDGSLVDDATALIATHLRTGFQWPLGIWESDGPEWEIDKRMVSATVAEAFATYEVVYLYADPSKWETQLAEWGGAHGEKKVLSVPTVRVRQMAQTLKAYAGAIVAGEQTHNGNPVFRRHIGNAHKALQNFRDDDDSPLWLIRKDRPMSANKIDAAMAGALSWQARLDAISEGLLNQETNTEVFFV